MFVQAQGGDAAPGVFGRLLLLGVAREAVRELV